MKKKAIYIFFFFLFYTYASPAQNKLRDSLNQVARSAHDTLRVRALSKISSVVASNSPDSAFLLSDSALRLAQKIDYRNGIAVSYQSMGNAQTTSGRYDEAIQSLLKALQIFENLKDKNAISNTYNTLANAYMGQKNREKAYDYYLKSYKLSEQAPRYDHMVAISSVGLAGVLIEKAKYSEAISYYQKAESYFTANNKTNLAAMVTSMMGEAYYRSGDLFTAEKYYRSVLPLFRKTNNEYALAGCLSSLGSVEFQRKNYVQAKTYFEEALAINKKRNALDNIQTAAFELSRILELLNKPAEALAYYKIYVQYKDSVINEARNRTQAEAEQKYESEKKAKELQLKNMELENSQMQVSQRNALLYVFAGATLIFIVLLFFVYNQFAAKRKANLLLETKNTEVEFQKSIIEEKNKDITDSINYSRHIQRAILPSTLSIRAAFNDSFVIYKPKDIISGDFYFLEKDEDCVYLTVLDCTGHGVPGAMLSIFAQSALKNIIASANYKHNPAGILKELCHQFKINLQAEGSDLSINDGADVAVCILHPAKNILYFAGARNDLHRVKNGKIDEFSGNRYGISGVNTGIQTEFTDYVIDVEKDDRYYLFTDGYADQFGGAQGKKFKQRQLKQVILESSSLSFKEQQLKLTNLFDEWKGNLEQVDDVTLLGFLC